MFLKQKYLVVGKRPLTIVENYGFKSVASSSSNGKKYKKVVVTV
jgi:hypothetical protein